MAVISLVTLVLVVAADATLQLLEGPYANRIWTAVPTALHLGPQRNHTVTARLRYLPRVDACDAAAAAAAFPDGALSGQAVLVRFGTCRPEAQYEIWAGRGVAALLTTGVFQPGGMFCYLRDGPAPAVQGAGPPYIQLTDDADLYAWLETVADVPVRLDPDPNPWVAMYDSSAYQIGSRLIPSALMATAALLSWTFLYRHAALLRDRRRSALTSARTQSGFAGLLRFLWRNVTAAQLVLVVLGVQCAVVATVRAVGGYFSTGNLSGPVQRFFFEELWGLTQVAVLTVSSIWNRARRDLCSSQSLLVRLLSGDYPTVTAVVFTSLLGLEMVVAVSYATYTLYALSVFYAIPGLLDLLTVVVVALQMLVSAAQLRRHVGAEAINNDLQRYMRRMGRLVTVLGVFLFLLAWLFLVLSAYIGIWTPALFLPALSAVSILHAAVCIVVALLLKPRRPSRKRPGTTPAAAASDAIILVQKSNPDGVVSVHYQGTTTAQDFTSETKP